MSVKVFWGRGVVWGGLLRNEGVERVGIAKGGDVVRRVDKDKRVVFGVV